MPSLSRLLKKVRRVPNDLQLYQALKSGSIDRATRIACRPRPDGGGALVHSRMSAMCFANAAGIGYLHTPFSAVTHAEGNPEQWTRRWSDFFNLGLGETPVGDEPVTDIKAVLDHPRLYRRRPGLIVSALHFHGFCDRNPDAYRAVIPKFRTKYFASDKSTIPLHRGGNGLTIAVHIRRGDVSPADSITASRFTDDNSILEAIARAKAIARDVGMAAKVNIFSEGDPHDFARFADLGCDLHIGGDVFETFHNLVECDVLMMAKSAFSYVAALLSDSIKLYDPFWSKPLSDWFVIGRDNAFDEAGFRKQLEARSTRQLR